MKSYDSIKNWIRDNPLKAVALGNIMADSLVLASGLLHKNTRDIAGLLGLGANCYAMIRSRKKVSAPIPFNENAGWRQIGRESAAALKDATWSLLRCALPPRARER